MLIQDLKINKFKSTFGIIVKCLTKVLFKKKIIHFFYLSLSKQNKKKGGRGAGY